MKRLDKDYLPRELCCSKMLDAVKKGYVTIYADVVYKQPHIEIAVVWSPLIDDSAVRDNGEYTLKNGVMERTYMNYCPWCGKASRTLVCNILRDFTIKGVFEV